MELEGEGQLAAAAPTGSVAARSPASAPAPAAAPAAGPAAGPAAAPLASESAILGRIAAGPDAGHRAQALTLAQRVQADCHRSEAQLTQTAVLRSHQIRGWTGGLRATLAGTIAQSTGWVRGHLLAAVAATQAAVLRVSQGLRNALNGALGLGQLLGQQLRSRMLALATGAADFLGSRIRGVARSIQGLIHAVPFPNIPGVARIRGLAAGFLDRAAGFVQGAVNRVVGLISQIIHSGLSLLESLLVRFAQLALRAVDRIDSLLGSILGVIGQALQQAISIVTVALNRLLTAFVHPVLNRVEALARRALAAATQVARSLVRRNYREFLQALADTVSPSSTGRTAPAVGNRNAPGAELVRLGQIALLNNRRITQGFEALTGGSIAAFVRNLISAFARLPAVVGALVSRVMHAVDGLVERVLASLAQMTERVGAFLRELFGDVGASLRRVFDALDGFVQRTVERTWQFVSGAVRRLAGVLQDQVRRWLTGGAGSANAADILGQPALMSGAGPAALPLSGGPIVKPPPQVIDLIVRLVYGALIAAVSSLMVLLFGAELAAIIMANPVAVVVILVALALALLLLILLAYLLFRWVRPPPPKRPTKRVVRVRPRRLELGVGGPDLRAVATLAPGSPARPPLTWTLNPGGTVPAGVSIVGGGPTVNVRAAHPAHGTLVGGLPVTVRAALTANPADFADSAPITLVQVTSATYVAAPALAAVPSLIPGTPPPNTAEPNRDGLSGNTATVNATTLPAGRRIGVAFRTSLGARASRTTITPGSRTGDLALRITDTATKARLDETLPSTAGPARFMAELTVNAVPTRVSALTGAGPLGPYGVLNSITFASSDTLHSPLTRIVGELITNGGDEFNIPPPNGAFNPNFQLNLAVPANQWNDQLITPAGILHATNGRPAIDVNRFVGPGVPQLPRKLIYRQRFQYSAWHGAGTAISRTVADGRHIRSLIGAPPAAFQFRTEHVFGSVAAPPRNEPYVGNPLIVLSNLTVTPTAPGATDLAADGVSTATLGVTSSVAGRSVNWTVRGGGNAITAGNPAALPATATLTAGRRAGTFPLRSADTIFPNRRIDGSVRVAAVALRNIQATPNPAPAGTASVVVTLEANPGGRTVHWSVDAAAAAAGVTVSPNSTGPGAPAMATTVTRPAGFTGAVVVTANDSVLASRTNRIRIRFQ